MLGLVLFNILVEKNQQLFLILLKMSASSSPLGPILFLSLSASPFLFKSIKNVLEYLLKQNSKAPKKLTNALNKPALEPEGKYNNSNNSRNV